MADLPMLPGDLSDGDSNSDPAATSTDMESSDGGGEVDDCPLGRHQAAMPGGEVVAGPAAEDEDGEADAPGAEATDARRKRRL